MPLTHTRTFRVRYYECDAHGHLNNANYLRYMQETATDASAAAGYDIERYNLIKRLWLIRETSIEYSLALYPNDQVEVKTWVADFRRISSQRVYEFRKAGTGDLVARAHTDWVLIDTETGRPTNIPDEMCAAFFPEGLPASFPSRQPFPKPPPPPPGVFTMHRMVGFNDIDTMKHVNNATYLNYITECGMQVIDAFGWPWERMIAEGFGIILRRNHIIYRQPALLGDELEIATWASDIRRAMATRHYTIRRVGEESLIARASAYSVWVDLKSGRPVRIPQHFLADFAPNIVDQPSRDKRISS